ncbi:MAG: amidohydrolase family protein [Gammaproteobacteria bacterium]
MTRVWVLVLGLIGGAAMAMPPPPTVFAITGVTVVPMDTERVVDGQTVIVRDGRIEAIGPDLAIPKDAMTIDGRGRFLMPGLAEMHAHVPPQAHDAQLIEDTLFLYVANGITFARSMLGAPHHLELRERAARGEIVSPRIYTSGPSLNGNSVPTPVAAREMVAEQKRAGYDFLKIHPGLDRPRYDAIVAAADEHDIPFGGHVPAAVGLARALEAGQATIDHLDAFFPPLLRGGASLADTESMFFGWNLAGEVDESKIEPLVRRVRDARVWIVPTEALMQHLLLPEPSAERLAQRDIMRYVPRATRAQWVEAKRGMIRQAAYDPALVARFIDVRAKLMKALQDAGAGLLLGSDAPQVFNVPGFSIHDELRMLVDAGLTPYEALATGNVNVARFLGESDEFGTVEIGKRADLVLLEANPLADVANASRIAGVMLNGRWLPVRELTAGLEQIAQRND